MWALPSLDRMEMQKRMDAGNWRSVSEEWSGESKKYNSCNQPVVQQQSKE
ncbi:hypothetical protein SCP_0109270 [Sparassis crispa]|uniref:Uncharacterized protein n=1 Tax=Sparassis crispa TaxID=139825 RepID=A0A401G798_9APHY|nr:hypothetical protein SCP_0109270 [Sparassis crispa]GBE78045.1 hypothetical protein SCP_0109270 [Sparassis crispa]